MDDVADAIQRIAEETEGRNTNMIITAKFQGVCCVCGNAIKIGEKMEWAKGQPSRHATCEEPAIPADAINIATGSGYEGDGFTGFVPGTVIHNHFTPYVDDINHEPKFLRVLTAHRRWFNQDGMSFGVGDERGWIFSAVCVPATADEYESMRSERR